MKAFIFSIVFFIPMLTMGQHSFGFEGGVNSLWTSNPAVGYYGSALYAKTNGSRTKLLLETQYSKEGIILYPISIGSEKMYQHKLNFNPAMEFSLLPDLAIYAGLNGGWIFTHKSNPPTTDSFLNSHVVQEKPWDFALITGVRVYISNYFFSLRYNHTLISNRRNWEWSKPVNHNDLYKDTANIQIGIGYLFDPKEELMKMK